MLKIIDLHIHQGNFHLSADAITPEVGINAVLGPSGAGKSTLLSVLAGFDHPQQGRILWQGTDITKLPPSQRPVAMLFQDNNLFPHLTIYRNIALALTHKSRISADQHDRILQALDRVGLAGLADRKPAQSGATVLMVTHDPNDALRIAPKTILVADHKITGAFDTRDLLQNPPPALAAYLHGSG